MPFTKITNGENKGKYTSESGRIYTLRQIRAYFATGGWKRPVRKVNQLAYIAFLFTALVFAGAACSSNSATPAASPQETAVQVQQLPTAREIANQLHGIKFVQQPVGPVPNYIGQTSLGHFFIGGDYYIVSVFTNAEAMNKWLKEGAMYGFTPKWKGDSWVVVPPDSTFHGPTLPLNLHNR